MGDGTYVETIKPNINYELDYATMPHLLIRQPNGSFTFEQGNWGDRAVGDENSILLPLSLVLNLVMYFLSKPTWVSVWRECELVTSIRILSTSLVKQPERYLMMTL